MKYFNKNTGALVANSEEELNAYLEKEYNRNIEEGYVDAEECSLEQWIEGEDDIEAVHSFSKAKMGEVAEAIKGNKNPDVAAHIMYDTADGDIWVDFLLSGEYKEYHSDTIHEIEWADFQYHTIEITGPFVKVNSKALEHYFENRLKYEIV